MRPPAGVEQVGNLEVAPVRFEGKELFKVAAPRVRDRTNPGDQIPVELRAEQIESSLNPGMQWLGGRELRRRVRLALERHNIAIGKPQQDMWYRNTLHLMSQNGSSTSDTDMGEPADLNR
ncbi:MAG: hypothetical protein IGR76_00975 [Synechococcales cyanobacterium T60_A2020_003]|nr:hypothetical protein [Synechococcales cyanobacterium T60_A2020_003]